MRILIATPIFPPEQRGPATYCFELCQKINSKVITFTQNPTQIKDVEIISIPQTGGTLVRQLRLFWQILNSNCDLIYAQGADVVGFASIVAAKLLRRPVVIKFVGDLSVEMERDFGKKVEYLFFATKIVLSFSDKILFPAGHLQESICKKYQINKNKTEVIYNAVN